MDDKTICCVRREVKTVVINSLSSVPPYVIQLQRELLPTGVD